MGARVLLAGSADGRVAATTTPNSNDNTPPASPNIPCSKLGADYSSRSYRSDDGSSDGRNYDSTAADIQQLLMRVCAGAPSHLHNNS